MFLTGRDNEVDKILGLEIGADDYITKPFNPRELTIRARNLLSRTMNLGTVSEERRSVESYKFNGWNSISTAVPWLAERRTSTSCRAVNSARCCISAKTRAKFSLVPSC
ncbi:Aerobic respiration control protein arcA [Klebsiella pneumoniae]|uniref:Aerobic respiration control protein arcA n=1 Tax=Klebsiella pneumoniae TaxID=573 RepID=A0A2X3E692_KLEPN|nr:Aerobic respiration control protein arcA [Klebsiella pneumoniae]